MYLIPACQRDRYSRPCQPDCVRSRWWFIGPGAVWSAAAVVCRWTRSALPVSSEPCAFQIPNSQFPI